MDSIKLERIEAFNVNETLHRPRPAPLTIEAAPIQAAHISIRRPTYQELTPRTNNQEPRRRSPPSPIYPKVIPLLPTLSEIRLYEESMARFRHDNNEMTVGRALLPFNWPMVLDTERLATKSLFLKNLLRKIDAEEINYDLAVLCRDRSTEEAIYNFFLRFNFTSIELSYFAPSQQLFGIIFKFRKSKQIEPVRSSYVDLIITYDSLYHQNYDRAMNYFYGTHSAKPWITHLVDMGTPDAHVFNYNQTARHPIPMDARLNSLNTEKRDLFFGPNVHNSFNCWVDYASTHLWNWMKSKPTVDFVFVPPTKRGPLLDEYNRFNLIVRPAPVIPVRQEIVHTGVASVYRPDHRFSSPNTVQDPSTVVISSRASQDRFTAATSSRSGQDRSTTASSSKRMRDESVVVESPSKHRSKERTGANTSPIIPRSNVTSTLVAPPNRTRMPISSDTVDAVKKFLDKASAQNATHPVVAAASTTKPTSTSAIETTPSKHTMTPASTRPTDAVNLDETLTQARVIDPIDRAIAQALEAPADTYDPYPPTDTMDVSDVGTGTLSYADVNDQVHQDSNNATSSVPDETTTPAGVEVDSSHSDKSTTTSGVKMDDFLARALQQFEKDIEALKNQL